MYNNINKIQRKGDKVMGILEFINEVKAVIELMLNSFMEWINTYFPQEEE